MKSLMIAFSMYSSIPMPQFIWEEKDRKRAMCFFPLIGIVAGGVFWMAYRFMTRMDMGIFFRAAVLTAVPVFVTGGIHMDGFLDTCDARASYGDRKKKLEILKDTHTGAFAVSGGVIYMLFYFASCTELTRQSAASASIGFILSRSLSGFAAATFPEARKQGMLADFMRDTHKKMVAAVMAAYILVSVCLMVYAGGVFGILSAFGAFLVFLYYRHMALTEFGGVTGDLAGYFLQLCELAFVLIPAVFKYLV